MHQLPYEITEAIRLQKEKDRTASKKLLQDYLVNKTNAIDAILWLAKVSDNPQEAMDAAELAYFLCPENETAQRAVAAIGDSLPENDTRRIELDLLKLTGITELQARTVIWPFRGRNRPIGVLLDEKEIDLRDVAWAAENAYDSNIQKASRTILLSSIFKNRVKEPQKPVTIIEGIDNTGYHERMAILKTGILMGILILISILIIVLPLTNRFFNYINNYALGVICLLGMIFAILVYKPAAKSVNEFVNYRLGREGERKVVDLLRASLYSPWAVIHGFEFPNRKWGDADIILLGPGGIWCFEVKSYSSQTRNIGEKWQYRSRFGWRNMSKNPTKQAQRNAMRVKDYLESQDVRTRWVQPVIVWAGDEKNLSLEDPLVPVWTLSDIGNKLEEFWRKQQLSDEQISNVVNVLADAVEKVKLKSQSSK